MFKIITCRLLALKDLAYFSFDVGRLLFGNLLRIGLLKIFLDLSMKFSLRIIL